MLGDLTSGRLLCVVSRGLVGMVFIVAAVLKLTSLDGTIAALSSYVALSTVILKPLVVVISVLELTMGLALYGSASINRVTSIDHASLLLVSFFLGIGLFRTLAGTSSACGCFGSLSLLESNTAQLIFDLLLVSLAIVPYLSYGIPRSQRLRWLGFVIPTVFAANLIAALLAGYQRAVPIPSPPPSAESAWAASQYSDQVLANAISRASFGPSYVAQRVKSLPLHKVVNSAEPSVTRGWILDQLVRVEDGLLRITVALDTNHRIADLQLNPVVGPYLISLLGGGSLQQLERETMATQRGPTPFLLNPRVQPESEPKDTIAKIVSSVINDSINRILLLGFSGSDSR